MSMFDDEIKRCREKIDLQDGRLKQLLLEEGVHRDTLADDRRSDVWPAARERLDSIQPEITREEAVLNQARQDLQNVYAVRDAVERAVSGLQSDARPATFEEAREIADRMQTTGQAIEAARRDMLEQQRERTQAGAEHLHGELERYVAQPEMQAIARSSSNDGQRLQAELRNPDVTAQDLPGTDMPASIGGVDVLLQVAIWRRVLQQRHSDREERATLLQGDALVAQQAADVHATQSAIAKEWKRTPEERAAELAEYDLTPAAPGDYYKNLFDHQVQRLHQELKLDQKQWAELGLATKDGGNPATALWREGGENSLSRTVCHQYANREVGVAAVEKPLVEYERVLRERGEEDVAVKLVAHRQTLEKAAEPAVESRAKELHAQYFRELEAGASPPSHDCSDRSLGSDLSGLDDQSRADPELDR